MLTILSMTETAWWQTLRAVPTVATELVCFFSWGKQLTALSCIAAPSIWWVTCPPVSWWQCQTQVWPSSGPWGHTLPFPHKDTCSLGHKTVSPSSGFFPWVMLSQRAPGRRTWSWQSSRVSVQKREAAALFQFNLLMKQDGAHFPLLHTSRAVWDEAQLIYLCCLWRRMPANAVQELLSLRL